MALPPTIASGEPFPHRDQIVTVALTVVLVTLVAQGLTLTPLTKRLRVGTDVDDAAEMTQLRLRASTAALEHVRAEASTLDEDVRAAALAQYEGYLTAQQSIHRARAGDDDASDRRARELERVLRRASDVERRLVLEARRRGEVSAGSADEVLRDIENRALRDFA